MGWVVPPSLDSSIRRLFGRSNNIHSEVNASEEAAPNSFAKVTAMFASLVLVIAALLSSSTNFANAYHFGNQSANYLSISSFAPWPLGFFEILLGAALLQFTSSRQIWLIASLTFAVYFVVSLMKGLEGRQACDCFGAIVVWPFYTAALDLILALACFIILLRLPPALPRKSGSLRSTIGITLAFSICFLAVLWLREASGLGRAAGVPPLVGILHVSEVHEGGAMDGELLLANRGDATATVVGSERSCTLKLLDEFPFFVEPQKVTRIRVELLPKSDRPVGIVPATLLLNDAGVLRSVRLNLAADH